MSRICLKLIALLLITGNVFAQVTPPPVIGKTAPGEEPAVVVREKTV